MSQDYIDWQAEQERFLEVAHAKAVARARRAFRRWHPSKRDDATQEFLGKLWESWAHLVETGKDPEPMVYALIHYALLHVRYDRRIAGRDRRPYYDVFDYGAQMNKHDLDWSPEDPIRTTEEEIDHEIDKDAWLNSLDKTDQALVYGLIMGATAEEMAIRLGISTSRISRIRKRLAASYRESLHDLD